MSSKSSSQNGKSGKCFVPMECHQISLLKHKVDEKGGFVLLVEPGVYSGDQRFYDARISLFLAPDIDVNRKILSVKPGRPNVVKSECGREKFKDGFECLLRYLPSVQIDAERRGVGRSEFSKSVSLTVALNHEYDFVIGRRQVSYRDLFRDGNLVVYIGDVESIWAAMRYALGDAISRINHSLAEHQHERYQLHDSHIDAIIAGLAKHRDHDFCQTLSSREAMTTAVSST